MFFEYLLLSLSASAPQVSCGEELPVKESETLSLSLDDIIQMALGNNRDIQIQEQEVAYARANITAAQSKFFPDLNIGYGFTYNDTILYGD